MSESLNLLFGFIVGIAFFGAVMHVSPKTVMYFTKKMLINQKRWITDGQDRTGNYEADAKDFKKNLAEALK